MPQRFLSLLRELAKFAREIRTGRLKPASARPNAPRAKFRRPVGMAVFHSRASVLECSKGDKFPGFSSTGKRTDLHT